MSRNSQYSDVSHRSERSTAVFSPTVSRRRTTISLNSGGGSARLCKLPGFTLCHFDQDRADVGVQTCPSKNKNKKKQSNKKSWPELVTAAAKFVSMFSFSLVLRELCLVQVTL